MSRPSLALTAIVLTLAALTASASASGQPPTAAAPSRPPPTMSAGRAPPAAATALAPSPQGMSRPTPRKAARHRHRRPLSPSLATIALANAEARDGPSSGAFVNSALYHRVRTRPALRHPHQSALPDHHRPAARREADLQGRRRHGALGAWVKPRPGRARPCRSSSSSSRCARDLRTNIVLTTDQRTYLIDAVSTAGAPIPAC
jgi:hypothetical protein